MHSNTSRELDPQLHSHVFIFNLAPRRDGTWGAIVSRELYKAQKRAGAEYRSALARELERAGYAIERSADTFRVAAIPGHVERAFSKRRQAIETAATVHGYRSPKGMELAALRTRQAKRDVRRDALFEVWGTEARGLGFDLSRDATRGPVRPTMSTVASPIDGHAAAATAMRHGALAKLDAQLTRAASKVTAALQAVNQSAAMPGLAVDLRQREWEFARG